MLLLSSTSDAISVVTSAATNVDVHASWVDNSSGAINPGRTNTAIATATTTTVVAAPAVSTQRNVKLLAIRNRDAAVANTVTVKLTDGTLNMELISSTLAAGEELHFVEGIGFIAYLASGALKQQFSPFIPAGTASLPSLELLSGTLRTSPVGGDFEYDGVLHYGTPVTAERGVINEEQWLGLTATFTLASQTAAQKMFNTPTNGQITVGGNRTYQFESLFDLSAMSATSGSFGWALGGTATLTSIKWTSTANKAALATAASAQETMNSTAANTTLATATTNTVGWAAIRGLVRVNAAGTLIPQVSLGIAAAAVVSVNSFFRCWPVGTGSTTSVGNWS